VNEETRREPSLPERQHDPDLSVILVTPAHFSALRQTLAHLRAQSVRHRLEIVIVCPDRWTLALDESEMAGFHGFQIVELDTVPLATAGRVAGIRHARAPVVALAEDHCFPAPDWAEALIAAHRGTWAVVGPVVVNANPGTAISRTDFLLGYGPWLDPTPAGRVSYLPGHNSAYKRDVLLSYGDALEAMLEIETILHWDLRARGYELYLEPRARAFHFNFSRPASWLLATFFTARTFAARRLQKKRCPTPMRLLYLGATPLIPIVRLRRCLRDFLRSGQPASLLLRTCPAIACQLVVSALGEATGYAFGAGNAPRRYSEFEFRRDRHVTPRDRAAMAAAQCYPSDLNYDASSLRCDPDAQPAGARDTRAADRSGPVCSRP
jgi:GT2 family glycosyltransferase